ncbi:DEAD/DEAH box helicase [bacterium]|nr:DEAD/DEAH box helicase [bacterium]
MEPQKTPGRTRGGPEPKKSPKPEATGFAEFGLARELLRTVERLGWATPTPVQQEAIPPVLAGHDLIALAQTGTGKTGAYLLPILTVLIDRPRAKPLNPSVVVLAPTRELVQQIDEQVKSLGAGLGIRSMTIFGGVSDRPQISQLMAGVELVVATPGRLLDLIGQRLVHFAELTHCVLDEADRMFDMGFIADLKRILYRMPARRQTLLFSATMPDEIKRLTREFLYQPREVQLAPSKPPEELSHEVWELEPDDKNEALARLLREDYDSVLVFTRTKHRADRVARQLARGGENVAVLHGDRSQKQRDLALDRFKQGDARVLVATDVASRGLDITGIGLVINYDTPRDPDDYVHRVGRTARAKRQGRAVTLLTADEAKYIRKIEQLLKQRIDRYGDDRRNSRSAADDARQRSGSRAEEDQSPAAKTRRRRRSRKPSGAGDTEVRSQTERQEARNHESATPVKDRPTDQPAAVKPVKRVTRRGRSPGSSGRSNRRR